MVGLRWVGGASLFGVLIVAFLYVAHSQHMDEVACTDAGMTLETGSRVRACKSTDGTLHAIPTGKMDAQGK